MHETPTDIELEKLIHYLDQNFEEGLARLTEYLRIPSVSTDTAYTQQIQEAAELTSNQLKACGLDSKIEETGGHPCVFATTPKDMLLDSAKSAPTILFYGHYDVQPPDPLEKWVSDPFKPEIRDGAIYARGASDDKGQVSCFLEALRAWKNVYGGFPLNIKVLIEGEEECGSDHLQAYLIANQVRLKSDIVLVSDTAMWDKETVGITYGLRGLLYFDIKLHGPGRDLHSGVYGGSLANPATQLTKVIGKLFNEANQIAIPGFYDDVVTPEADERNQWQKLKFDETGYFKEVDAEAFGEHGYSTLERKWIRPSCDVNGLYGGYMGEGAKTVIGTFAGAKVSFRLAYNQDPGRIAKLFEAWIRRFDVGDLTWEITSFGEAAPVMVPYRSPFIDASQKAIMKTSGKPAALIRAGATIPVIADFKKVLGVDTLLIGFGLNDDGLHSPNEKFNLDCFKLGSKTHAVLLHELSIVSLDGT